MREDDPIAGVSFRNTKRHFRKKYGPVGPDGPRVPEAYPVIAVKPGREEVHVHPRAYREELCGCGYPARPCTFLDDDTRNHCFKEHGAI